ncbi:hypothetical protein F4810DRAFT_716331 [Camillea tinctor]|nr:hypothetical protein F4810DRAFT_716331 [Camillea tinctor]
MRTFALSPFLLPLFLVLAHPHHFASADCVEQPSGACSSCGWFCNQGCSAPLDRAECARCLYCRRESSSCGFLDVSGTWTEDPPSEELCASCAGGCWCYGDWYCADDGGQPTPSPSTSGAAARRTG